MGYQNLLKNHGKRGLKPTEGLHINGAKKDLRTILKLLFEHFRWGFDSQTIVS